MFVGLNPSTADELTDDPTVRGCMRFAESWGFGGIILAILFAYRRTDPRSFKSAADPVGPENDFWTGRLASEAHIVIAAWGVRGGVRERDKAATRLLGESHCLGLTKHGRPRHPQSLRSDCKPVKLAV
ncbi:MAG: DUF1643 domain-containing protein [Syntrophobacteraceae bacterium]